MPGDDGYLDELEAIRSAKSRDAAVSQAVAIRADASIAHSLAQGVDEETARSFARQNAELDREEIEANLLDDERENASVNGRFRSGRQLVEIAPLTVAYAVRPWCAVGTISELDGKPKVAGKTTLMLHMVRAVIDGQPFLGEPTKQGPVVLLTEQSSSSIAPSLRALGLDRDELSILTWPDAFGTAWPAIVDEARAECERVGALLLVVDTLGQFVGIRGESENDAGAALEAMAPLQAAAASGLAVLVTRHDRKAGGDVGESGRGSNAWSGAVDCIIALRRPLNPARSSIREIEAISRRGDVPQEPVLIELTDAGYVVLGSETAVAFAEAREAILAVLDDREWHVEKELIEAAGETSRSTVRDALAALVTGGTVEKGSRKKVTEPYPYRLVSPLTTVAPSLSRPLTVYNRLSTDAATLQADEPDIVSEAMRIFGDAAFRPPPTQPARRGHEPPKGVRQPVPRRHPGVIEYAEFRYSLPTSDGHHTRRPSVREGRELTLRPFRVLNPTWSAQARPGLADVPTHTRRTRDAHATQRTRTRGWLPVRACLWPAVPLVLSAAWRPMNRGTLAGSSSPRSWPVAGSSGRVWAESNLHPESAGRQG